jgi:hypothetical protein
MSRIERVQNNVLINMPDEKRNPDVYEQFYLLNIESQNKMLVSDIEKFCIRLKKDDIPSRDLSPIISLLESYEKYFLTYEPIAQRLTTMGRTQLSKRLYEILSDVQETFTIFQQSYHRSIGDKKSADETNKNMSDADETNKNMSDADETN